MMDFSDPTRNVLQLVDAAMARQDDLRRVQGETIDGRLNNLAKHHEDDIVRLGVEIDRRFLDVKERLEVANQSLNKQLDQVNAARTTRSQEMQALLPRQEYSVQHQALVDRLTKTEDAVYDARSKFIGLLAAAVLFTSAATAVIIKATGG